MAVSRFVCFERGRLEHITQVNYKRYETPVNDSFRYFGNFVNFLL